MSDNNFNILCLSENWANKAEIKPINLGNSLTLRTQFCRVTIKRNICLK